MESRRVLFRSVSQSRYSAYLKDNGTSSCTTEDPEIVQEYIKGIIANFKTYRADLDRQFRSTTSEEERKELYKKIKEVDSRVKAFRKILKNPSIASILSNIDSIYPSIEYLETLDPENVNLFKINALTCEMRLAHIVLDTLPADMIPEALEGFIGVQKQKLKK